MSVKISDSNIYVRTALLACMQYYLCVQNLVYSEVPNKCPPSLPAYYFGEIWAPSPLLITYLDLQPRLLISEVLQILYKDL